MRGARPSGEPAVELLGTCGIGGVQLVPREDACRAVTIAAHEAERGVLRVAEDGKPKHVGDVLRPMDQLRSELLRLRGRGVDIVDVDVRVPERRDLTAARVV